MNTPPHLKCFQFFIFWIIFDITSDSMCASLKKGTKRACPENGKTHSWKTGSPVWGTVAQRFQWNHSVGCPYFGKTHSWKTGSPVWGTVAQRFPVFCSNNVHFLARSFWHIFIFILFESIYDVIACVPKKFRKLPSARRIFPKVFRRSHFWTSILVHFPGNFSSLVQTHFEI